MSRDATQARSRDQPKKRLQIGSQARAAAWPGVAEIAVGPDQDQPFAIDAMHLPLAVDQRAGRGGVRARTMRWTRSASPYCEPSAGNCRAIQRQQA